MKTLLGNTSIVQEESSYVKMLHQNDLVYAGKISMKTKKEVENFWILGNSLGQWERMDKIFTFRRSYEYCLLTNFNSYAYLMVEVIIKAQYVVFITRIMLVYKLQKFNFI